MGCTDAVQPDRHLLESVGISVPWLAIDDDDEGWPDDQREHLVLTDSMQGLSKPGVLDELINKLET